ncbi:MAG: molybdopterin-dependent oxidoreductase [Haloarculaceae archaeon]
MGARSLAPPRLLDWSLFVAVAVLLGTGLGSLFAGTPDDWWVLAAHGVVGLALVPLLAAKLWRVRHRLRHRPRGVAVSVLLAIVAVAALGTGVAWVLDAGVPVGPVPPLVVHAVVGIAAAALLLAHLRRRAHDPRAVDLRDRRTALRYAGLLVGGALVWRGQSALARLRGAAPRRFTGSREHGSDDGNAFPVTSWVADDPDPVALDAWSLRVDGLVATPRTFDAANLPGGARERALLDCTSGWYSDHEWRGVRVGGLLAAAGASDEARWVQFRSVTGYRWSLPIAEARESLLATTVDGERLSHGHGFPLRLVAPGRRGFQWVKWVDRVTVRRRRDRSEWLAVFVSGLDGR